MGAHLDSLRLRVRTKGLFTLGTVEPDEVRWGSIWGDSRSILKALHWASMMGWAAFGRPTFFFMSKHGENVHCVSQLHFLDFIK